MTSIENLRSTLDEMALAFKKVERAIGEIDFDQLSSLVDDVTDDLDDTEDEASTLRSSVAGLEDQVSDLEDQVQGLEAQLSEAGS